MATLTGSQLAHIFQSLSVGSSPTVRAIGNFHQFKIYNEPGYFISEDNRYVDYEAGAANWTAILDTGVYDNMATLMAHVVAQLRAYSSTNFSQNYAFTSTTPTFIEITGTNAWFFRWTNGDNADSTARLAAMLGYDVTAAESAANNVQTGSELVYYRQAARIEIAAGVVNFDTIKRRP